MILAILTIILFITLGVYLICLVFDIDPPQKDAQIDSWLGLAFAFASTWAAENREPTLKERLYKPISVIASKKIGIVALVISGGVLAFYAYKVLDWFFTTLWAILSSKPFLITTGSIAAAVGLFFIIRVVLRYRKECENKSNWLMYRGLENDIRDKISIPVPDGAVTEDNFLHFKQYYDSFFDVRNSLESIPKAELFDKKLKLFYDLSIKAEAGSDDIYERFSDALDKSSKDNDSRPLRTDEDEVAILRNRPLDSEKVLRRCQIALEDDRVSPLSEELQIVAEEDTSSSSLFGLAGALGFSSEKKVLQKTSQLRRLYEAACSEVKELQEVASGLNEILKYSRVCAYRNIYLGVELLNFIRDNAGGKNLRTAADSLNVEMDLDFPDYDSKDLTVDMIGVLDSSVRSTLNYYGSNQQMARYASENPKAALLFAGLNVIGDYFSKRSEVIDNNLEIQQKIIESFPQVVEGYLDGKANTLRAIEVIRGIINANKGFVSVYAPLRDKVFGEGTIPSLREIQQLAIATNEYNKISKTEL